MRRFGENPYSEPLYRVVFSDSRTDLIGGKWPDGACEYREVPRYPDVHAWILEKWMSPEEYAGKPEAYAAQQLDLESGLYTCGPYPDRGEYQICYAFPHQPGESMILQVVTAIKLSRDVHAAERKNAYMDAYAKQDKEHMQRISDIVDDAQGGFATASAVVSAAQVPGTRQGWKRGGDMPLERFDQASPLPTHDNYFGTTLNKSALIGEHNGNRLSE